AGGNITGIHGRAWELASKQLELLKQAVPSVTQVAVLGGLNWSRFPPELNAELMEPARSLGMELHFFNIHEPSAFDSAFAAMTTARPCTCPLRINTTGSPADRQRDKK